MVAVTASGISLEAGNAALATGDGDRDGTPSRLQHRTKATRNGSVDWDQFRKECVENGEKDTYKTLQMLKGNRPRDRLDTITGLNNTHAQPKRCKERSGRNWSYDHHRQTFVKRADE